MNVYVIPAPYYEEIGLPSFETFCLAHGLTVKAEQSPNHNRYGNGHWTARFEQHVEIKNGGLRGVHGDGDTISGAVVALSREILGCTIVLNASRDNDRREITVPDRWPS